MARNILDPLKQPDGGGLLHEFVPLDMKALQSARACVHAFKLVPLKKVDDEVREVSQVDVDEVGIKVRGASVLIPADTIAGTSGDQYIDNVDRDESSAADQGTLPALGPGYVSHRRTRGRRASPKAGARPKVQFVTPRLRAAFRRAHA
jgi:hypothetical protein